MKKVLAKMLLERSMGQPVKRAVGVQESVVMGAPFAPTDCSSSFKYSSEVMAVLELMLPIQIFRVCGYSSLFHIDLWPFVLTVIFHPRLLLPCSIHSVISPLF